MPEERRFGGVLENRLAVGAAKIGMGQRLLAGCSGYLGVGKYLKANAHLQSCPAGADRKGIKELYDLLGGSERIVDPCIEAQRLSFKVDGAGAVDCT